MTLHKRTLLLRLQKVEAIIRPRGSKKARIAALSGAEKVVYEAWKQKSAEWHADRPGELAYIALLDYMAGKGGTPPPEMPASIARQINPILKISGNAELDYEELLESTKSQ